jgi:SAM-dependent methyltransferase
LEVDGIDRLLKKFGVSTNGKILDFSCGIGNHSIPLSKRGYNVIGFDPSSVYLRSAKLSARKYISGKKNLRFIQGNPYCSANVLKKNGETNFDAIIIMDNSFGYDSKSKDIKVLKDLSSLANNKCVLILETENRDWRLINFEPFTFFETSKIKILGKWKFHFETSVSQGSMKFYESSTKTNNMKLKLKLQMLMKLYSLHELIELIQDSGWDYRESYDEIVSLIPFANNSMSIFSVSILK